MIRKKSPVETRKKHISKLSLKLIGIVILAAVASASLFGFLFFNRYRMFHLAVDEETVKEEASEQIQALQDTITKKDISKENKKATKREMRKYKDLTLYLCDDEDTLNETSFNTTEDRAYVGTMSSWLNLHEPDNQGYMLKFHDGEAYLVIYSFIGLSFMIRLLIVVAVASTLLFIVVIMQFVHCKMEHVLSVEEEMQLIEAGDFHHTVIYKENGELTDLARQLNHLRSALYGNMLEEEEARDASQELVTAVSHDLRTPLTSLLGYLDILQMKTYKSDTARDNYIRRNRQRTGQIGDMSGKLFSHLLIYSRNEELQLHPTGGQAVLNMPKFYCEELHEQKFEILTRFERGSWRIMGREAVLMCVFDSVFSNI